MTKVYDTIIIGGGITGFSAAMYAARLKLSTLVVSEIRGGTIILTNDVANWPGVKQTDGIALAKSVEEHALSYPEVEVVDRKAVKVEHLPGPYIFGVNTEDGAKFRSKTLIFATGTEYRKLGVPGEEEFKNRGVHYCALCDGYFYKEKVIGVVGGSDSAAKEAILLTQWAKKVYVIVRRDKLRGEPINNERVANNPRIEVITNIQIKEIRGNEKVTHVILDKQYNGSNELKLDAVFVEVGHNARSELAAQLGVHLNEKKEIKINRSSETSTSGVYAAGDVADSKFKQAITGSAEGVVAAYSAYEYINNEKVLTSSDPNRDKKTKKD
ncbi:FAD-dependent oxidoreductase [Candidatus Micrarchaeota archaeon]|nr:FAD-dependent oxidoreductase [Candidatus Micrarchaeota archaeon]